MKRIILEELKEEGEEEEEGAEFSRHHQTDIQLPETYRCTGTSTPCVCLYPCFFVGASSEVIGFVVINSDGIPTKWLLAAGMRPPGDSLGKFDDDCFLPPQQQLPVPVVVVVVVLIVVLVAVVLLVEVVSAVVVGRSREGVESEVEVVAAVAAAVP